MASGGFDTPAPAIEATGLIKRFGDVTAVAGISFEVGQGELFGFLGPNGAGKTSTINMLTGLARPDGGSIRFDGIDSTHRPERIQHLIGVVPDESNLYPELTGFENLCFCAALYGLTRAKREERAGKLLAEFDLAQAGNRKFGGYSKGMKRKLTIAAGIIHGPRILFLDEPTTGIDVASARQIRERIKALNMDGCTVFLTTHYLEEAERLCHRIAFVVQGRVVQMDSVQNLMRDFEDQKILELTVSRADEALCGRMTKVFQEVDCHLVSDTVLRVTSSDTMDIVPLVRLCQEAGLEVIEARRIRPSLEDVFVRVTGLEADMLKREMPGQGKKK